MADSTIKITEFSGMNNIREKFGDIKSPRVVLNADVDADGRVLKRTGQKLYASAAGAHSLWAGSVMLVCIDDRLYRVDDGELAYLGAMNGKEKTCYAEVDGKVFISNTSFTGVYDPSAQTMGSWGISLPNAPLLMACDGGFDAGTYFVCFTVISGKDMSGNGPISSIELSEDQGISISNIPENGIVWVTDPDGNTFFYAGTSSPVVNAGSVEPLQTFLCYPPPPMENIIYAFGRIWGSSGKELIYTESHKFGLTRNNNKFSFDQDITLIAPVSTGIFVGMSGKTIFLNGTEPEKMFETSAGAGAVKGTLSYCNNIKELGDILGTSEKIHVDVPVWLSKEGIVIGNAAGRLFNLTHDNVRITPPSAGAAAFKDTAGKIQYVVSFLKGETKSGTMSADDLVNSIFLSGNASDAISGIQSDGAGFFDEVSCTVIRDGQIVPV